jgi:hypothetical protein
LEGRALSDALRRAIAERRGYCSWDVGHASCTCKWVVTPHSVDKLDVSGQCSPLLAESRTALRQAQGAHDACRAFPGREVVERGTRAMLRTTRAFASLVAAVCWSDTSFRPEPQTTSNAASHDEIVPKELNACAVSVGS